MRKFVLRLLLFCLAPMPLLLFADHVVDAGLHRSRHYSYAEWNDLFNGKINADMLIMGTSRARVQISPRILDSVLHINSYNLGMDACPFNIQYERFKLYLQHNKKPRYIIQEVGYTSTLTEVKKLPNPKQFVPYLQDPGIWHIVKASEDDPFGIADRYFPLYKYNNEIPLVREGIKSYMGKGVSSPYYKGYLGQDQVWDSSFHDFIKANPHGVTWPIAPNAVALLREYLGFCKAQGIQVIMVYPPAYIRSLDYILNKEEILAVYDSLSKEYDVPFLSYMYDSLNYSTANFYNSLHLNRKGSEQFSVRLAGQLQQYVHR